MIDKIYKIFLESTGICTDTRTVKEGNLFIALKGPNFNANKFAQEALDKGALCAIIDDNDYAADGKTIVSDDCLNTLQELAKFHRKQLNIPVIGITGSNGKTTTKELIAAVLSTTYKTFATKGNLNNHIGVPLSLLSVNQNHEIAIIEMGANHIGEIANLSAISQPTHGLITNIGKAHIGLFGGFEAIIRAKSELYDYLLKSNGVVFINQNQEILMNMSKRFKDPVLYPNPGAFYTCSIDHTDPFVSVITESGAQVNTKLIGKYNFDNIATALCIGKFFDVAEQKANLAAEEYVPEDNRSQIIKKSDNTIILDAYNANPSSMEMALENLSQMNNIKKLAIIGDMFELGDETETEHRAMGILLKKLGIKEVIFCGESMKFAYQSFGKGHYFKSTELLTAFLKNNKYHDHVILIKASRGMALENITAYL